MSISNDRSVYSFIDDSNNMLSEGYEFFFNNQNDCDKNDPNSQSENINSSQDWEMYENSKENESIGINPYVIHDGYFPDRKFPNMNALSNYLPFSAIDQNILNNKEYYQPNVNFAEPNEIITKRRKIVQDLDQESNHKIVIVNDVFGEIFKWADANTAHQLHRTSKFSYKNAKMFIDWINFNKNNPSDLIDKKSLKVFLKAEGIHIRYLNLSSYEKLEPEELIEIFNNSPKLQSLVLQFEACNFTENVTEKLFSLCELENLKLKTKDGFCLDKLCFKGLPKLRKIDLRCAKSHLFKDLDKLSSLRALILYSYSSEKLNLSELRLEKLKVDFHLTRNQQEQISTLSTLRSLNLKFEDNIKNDFFEKLTNLEDLELYLGNYLDLPPSIQALTSLKRLKFDSDRPKKIFLLKYLINLSVLNIHLMNKNASFLMTLKKLENIKITFYDNDLSLPPLYLLEKLKFVKINSGAHCSVSAIETICSNLIGFDLYSSSIVFEINRLQLDPTFYSNLKRLHWKFIDRKTTFFLPFN